ncbi:MAG: PAS domain S-box protein [Rhodocyclaceae bacterium]|nr:PAS domain S-box protein [Rhodocyclaceae bacterium]MDZ4214901.1 PAS domain S-box protein [Rhodocyclaceae bacterium]
MAEQKTPPLTDPEHRIRQLEAENARLCKQIAGDPRFSAERDLRSILDNLPSMIGYWDRDLRNRFGNHAYLDWFGTDPATMPGKHIREVIGEERYRLNLPYIEAALRGEFQQFERAIPAPDGKSVRHSLANYIPDIVAGEVLGFYVLVTDITAIKQAEDALRVSEARYREVVEDQTEIISRLRADGTFLFVNEVYCRIFGKTFDDLVGNKWMPVCYAEDLPHVQRQLAMLAPDHPVAVIENRVFTGDGRLRWMQFVNRGFFDNAGQLLEIQSVGRDITDRKQIEAALREAHESLELRVVERTEQLRRLAVEATLAEARERQAIAADLHDNLGQLLHVARVKLDAMEAFLLPGAALSEMNDLLSAASRQVRTLTSQLSPPILKRLGLAAALRWLAEEMDREYGLAVTVLQDAMVVTPSEAQREMLFRTARELLINVVKHAGTRQASLSLAEAAAQIVMTVEDRGVGIADPDHALNHTDGFGLASIRERIAYLDGTMEIARRIPSGLRVSVRLPLAASESLENPT